jgi:hypothetical protein
MVAEAVEQDATMRVKWKGQHALVVVNASKRDVEDQLHFCTVAYGPFSS